MRIRSRKSIWAASLLAGALASGNAAATPLLQLYIEGATYDSANESWYIDSHHFRLWAIGNLSGPGGTGGLPIDNVRLAVVYDSPAIPGTVNITLTPTLIGGDGTYGNFTDSTEPTKPAPLAPIPVTDGSQPLIGGTKKLPDHGEYGAGRTWQEFNLGSFNLPDAQLADFVNAFPTPSSTALTAQINAYWVDVSGADAHFDLYAWTQDERGRISYVFAPPSHDATDGPESTSVPVPATLALLGIGALGLGALRRRSR